MRNARYLGISRYLVGLVPRVYRASICSVTFMVPISAVTAAPTRFRLVLLDLTMPDRDGVAVFAALRTLAPELRVLLMSGYTEADVDARFVDAKPDGFMQKPVGAPGVLRAVRAILGQ
ncbi:MAG: response regulator, partial [Syntrophaceae bacterium]|nr:response regulator [Syntrophaceae bacterium]